MLFKKVDINLVMGSGPSVATPVIRNVAGRGLSSLSSEIASLENSLFSGDVAASEAVRSNAEKMAVGTFCIHNLGKST
jgi:pyruvate/2-oxoglutarate dehydrogenase complex dihydrolipoamide acyltransferase (E2) component